MINVPNIASIGGGSPPSSPHQFLRFDKTPPDKLLVRRILAYMIGKWVGKDITVTQMLKARDLKLRASHGSDSIPIDIRALLETITSNRNCDMESLGVEKPGELWLDGGPMHIKRNFCMLPGHDETVTLAMQVPIADTFPLRPSLDREGFGYASFQYPLQHNVIQMLENLVFGSHLAVDAHPDWVNWFRALVSDCVSLVDITLHQAYFRAKFGGDETWKFDETALGPRSGVRLKDKLKWIGLITGQSLDNARDEVQAFHKLRKMRNHLNHFDPPCLILSIDDIAEYLNLVPAIGMLLWKIRIKLKAQLTSSLVSMILAPRVLPNQVDPSRPRPDQAATVGYRSSVWPEDLES
jgi:hypothetical protein